MFLFRCQQSIIFSIVFLTVIYSALLSIGRILAQWSHQYFLKMLSSVDQWRGEIGNFNNRIASNLLLPAYHLNIFYKFLFPVFYFLFVVIVCVLLRKCLINLLKFFSENQLRKLCFEFHHKLLSCLYLAILRNYLTWFITIILLSGIQKSIQFLNLVLENVSQYAIGTYIAFQLRAIQKYRC